MTNKSELAALERDLIALERARIRDSFSAWCRYALSPQGLVPAAHHRYLIAKLQAVADGKIKRLMVLMPPGSAKSTYASRLFPAWLLARQERYSIIGASHTANLAEDFSRDVQSYIRDNIDMLGGIELANTGADLWRTTNGGRYKSAGVDGPITGSRADIAIIDDPVKSAADAESEAYRERAWKWFISDLRTRLKPGAGIVLVMTRWHQDDLGGRILDTQRDLWDVVTIPAYAGDDDPLGRAPGEVLGADDPNYRLDLEIEAARTEMELSAANREFAALYQQSPRPAEGALFRVANIETVDAVPVGAAVRAWDLAATKKLGSRNPDWTVGLKLVRTQQGKFIVADVVRLRGGPDEIERAIVNTAELDGRTVRIGIPQDPGQAGKAQILYLTRQLAGYTVDASPETGDKTTRAMPVTSQVNVGNFAIVRAPWNRSFLDELAGFPNTSHDDQVDALSRAFSMIGMRRPPMTISPQMLAAF